MYEMLLSLPLFQGMSPNDLSSLLDHVPLKFSKMDEGKLIARESSICDNLLFLLSGSLKVITWADDKSYCFSQGVGAPYVFQMEHLFGLHCHFTHDYQCAQQCQFLSIPKQNVLRILGDYIVFRLNFINMLSKTSHKYERNLWHQQSDNIPIRICRFLLSHAIEATGEMEVKILMKTLAREIGSSRLEVSEALHVLSDQGLLEMYRGRIIVPRVELLSTWHR